MKTKKEKVIELKSKTGHDSLKPIYELFKEMIERIEILEGVK